MNFTHISLGVCFAVPILCGVTGCAHDQEPEHAIVGAQTTPEEKKGDTMKSEKSGDFVDPQKAAHAVAVLRVKFLAALGGNKYAWDKVEVLNVIKNESRHSFDKIVEIAHYSWEPGIPEGECTIYIVPYNEAGEDLWKLVDGTAKQGVSHVK
jgi:hypothetical protein